MLRQREQLEHDRARVPLVGDQQVERPAPPAASRGSGGGRSSRCRPRRAPPPAPGVVVVGARPASARATSAVLSARSSRRPMSRNRQAASRVMLSEVKPASAVSDHDHPVEARRPAPAAARRPPSAPLRRARGAAPPRPTSCPSTADRAPNGRRRSIACTVACSVPACFGVEQRVPHQQLRVRLAPTTVGRRPARSPEATWVCAAAPPPAAPDRRRTSAGRDRRGAGRSPGPAGRSPRPARRSAPARRSCRRPGSADRRRRGSARPARRPTQQRELADRAVADHPGVLAARAARDRDVALVGARRATIASAAGIVW